MEILECLTCNECWHSMEELLILNIKQRSGIVDVISNTNEFLHSIGIHQVVHIAVETFLWNTRLEHITQYQHTAATFMIRTAMHEVKRDSQ